jgi:hypothetical protein
MTRKLSVNTYDYAGWLWVVNGERYRTNKDGEGLWVDAPTGAQWHDGKGNYEPICEFQQIMGTCQYSLSGRTHKQVYAKLYRDFISKPILSAD